VIHSPLINARQKHFCCYYVLGPADSKSSQCRLETVGGSHLNGEEVMIALLELLTESVLSEKQLGKIFKNVD